MGYYKQIDGVKYDNALVEAAKEAVAGRGDGRISKADAERLLTFVTDGGKITAVEQATLVYLRANFKWTDKANAWFDAAVAAWTASQGRTAPAPASTPGRPIVIVRVGSGHKTSRFFSDDLIEQGKDYAAIVIQHSSDAPTLYDFWPHTEPHRNLSMSHATKSKYVDIVMDLVRKNTLAFSQALGVSGSLSWQCGFDSCEVDTLIGLLQGQGYRIVEGVDVLG